MTVRWFVARDPDGTVSHLLRVHDSERAQWGEYYQDGRWIEDASVLDVLIDSTRGTAVTADEGEAIERRLLGG